MTWELCKDFYATSISPASTVLKKGTGAFKNSDTDSIFSTAELLTYKNNFVQLILKYRATELEKTAQVSNNTDLEIEAQILKQTHIELLNQILQTAYFRSEHFLENNCLRIYTIDRELFGTILKVLIPIQKNIRYLILKIETKLKMQFREQPKLIPWIMQGSLHVDFYANSYNQTRYPNSNNKSRKVLFKTISTLSPIIEIILSSNHEQEATSFELTLCYYGNIDGEKLLATLENERFPDCTLKKDTFEELNIKVPNENEIIRLIIFLNDIIPSQGLDSLKRFITYSLEEALLPSQLDFSCASPIEESKASPPPILMRATSPQYLKVPAATGPTPPQKNRALFKKELRKGVEL